MDPSVDVVDLSEMDEDEEMPLASTGNEIPSSPLRPQKEGDGKKALRQISAKMVGENISRDQEMPLAALRKLIEKNMSSKDIEEACKEISLEDVMKCSLINVHAPALPPMNPPVGEDGDLLHPKAPSVLVETAEDARCKDLHDFCIKTPIAVIRGMCHAIGFNLELFSSKTLARTYPEQSVEVRSQYLQSPDVNKNKYGREQWQFHSETKDSKKSKTIKELAKYQASLFLEQDQKTKRKARNEEDFEPERSSAGTKKRKTIDFGTNIDLTDGTKWKRQLQELKKLPPFLKVYSPGNILSHLGYNIIGMNTVQLYMKVAGCRTPGHQENNNVCSVNLNIGPGDCEWFAVDYDHWAAVARLCDMHKINYLTGSWWPILKDCKAAGIPVYRFTQHPGEFVWINCGVVHWVQALGICNNIAWNVGPLSSRQYQLALERYEWNKLHSTMSFVPMIRLSWNLARNLLVSDDGYFQRIKHTLKISLAQSIKLFNYVIDSQGAISCKDYPENDSEHATCCCKCKAEIFHVTLIEDDPKAPQLKPFCFVCAKKTSPDLTGFKCVTRYKYEDLVKVYDAFVLCEKNDKKIS